MGGEQAKEQTPLMQQYFSIKKQYPDTILFFRLGDFYEMFDADAVEVSRLINLTLTHRVNLPMCGIPAHSAKNYIARLLRLGKKIAICEQVGTPSTGKGIAERKVVEVITPGTAIEEDYLERTSNNFLASFWADPKKNVCAYAYIDISTTEFYVTQFDYKDITVQLQKELGKTQPRELLLCKSLENEQCVQKILEQFPNTICATYPDWHFAPQVSYERLCKQFNTVNLRAFSLTADSPEICAAGFLLEYAEKNSSTQLPHVTALQVYSESQFLIIDESTRKNLEIITNLRDGTNSYTLLETLNHTVTPMGSRMLRSWLLSPLVTIAHICERQEQVRLLYTNHESAKKLRSLLAPVLDVERLTSRIAMEKAHAKDLIALKNSLFSIISVFELYGEVSQIQIFDFETAQKIAHIIHTAILDDPSTIFTEGRLIKKGFSQNLDRLHELQNNVNSILDSYLEEEKQKTGISNLKIRFNRNDGYYMEVTKGKLDSVPEHFIRRRSMVSGERYTTQNLEKLEKELNQAGENIIAEERRLFLEIRDSLRQFVPYLFSCAKQTAQIDTLCALSYAAKLYNWVCPVIDDSDSFSVIQGRHPVVEMHLKSNEFVPNDLHLNKKTFALITGPNMAGKSTYLRQNALITILAQMGSFVPAKEAHIGFVDRIFCRVGASDNLARGESTFLVEMSETAHILRSATQKSFVIMDEVGRGTSTEDGLSIAWAVSEYLLNHLKAKTLFATHYHELTRLTHPNLTLLCLSVLEANGQVVFLKRIKEGATENSYGIHVAQMAGIPPFVIKRAEEILESVQKKATNTELSIPEQKKSAPALFSDEELIIDEILSLETDSITPLEALQKLARWKKTLKK